MPFSESTLISNTHCNTESNSCSARRSDWKRHKRDECAHHKADSHLDPRVQDEHSREDFRDAAVYWMDQCEAEMRYAARCALRPGLNGDTSATVSLRDSRASGEQALTKWSTAHARGRVGV